MTTADPSRSMAGVWLDDEPSEVRSDAAGMLGLGWRIDVIHPDDPRVDRELASSDFVLLDLRWRERLATKKYISAKRFAQHLTSVHPEKPLLLVSNFFVDQEFDKIESEINPVAITGRIDKHLGRVGAIGGNKRKEVIVDKIDEELHRMFEETQGIAMNSSLDKVPHSEFDEVFLVSPAEYGKMDRSARLELSKQAWRLASRFVDDVFDNSTADWIVLGGSPPAIIKWGNVSDRITDDDLTTMSVKYGSVPYIFSRAESLS